MSLAGNVRDGERIRISHRVPRRGLLEDGLRYPGGKGQSGTFQKIINLIPPHDTRIVSHLGGGNVLCRMRPAHLCYAIDLDPDAIRRFRLEHSDFLATAAVSFINGDAAGFVRSFDFQGHGRTFIFADPPYVIAARRSRRRIYAHEYTDDQHVELLEILRDVPALVMLCGLRCDLYDAMLADWNRVDYQNQTRGGQQTESLWLNYPPPDVPHDLTYAGENYRERERIRRKRARWIERLSKMPAIERAVILDALESVQKGRRREAGDAE